MKRKASVCKVTGQTLPEMPPGVQPGHRKRALRRAAKRGKAWARAFKKHISRSNGKPKP